MFYRTSDRIPLPKDPFAAIVSPRPIAWITTRDNDGHINLAPYSFFNAVAYTPPQIIVASIGGKEDRDQGKDTLSHIRETGVFCVNIAGYDDRNSLNQSSASYPSSVNEAGLLNLPLEECRVIDCPRLAHAPASLECRFRQILKLEGEANFLIVSRVEAIHLCDDFLTPDGHFDVTRYRPLSRLGYSDFSSIDTVFQMRRPRVEAD